MATNLDIDIAQLEALMELGGFASKREAVDAAVAEALQWRQQQRAAVYLGTIDFGPQQGVPGLEDRVPES